MIRYVQQEVEVGGYLVSCTPSEAEILRTLAKGRPVGRHNFAGRSLGTHVNALRKKIPDGFVIKSEYGTGMYYMHEVTATGGGW